MIARYSISALVAVGITFALFFVMNLLISTGREAITEVLSTSSINITREEREEQVEEKERELPEKPKEIEQPEAPEVSKTESLRPGGQTLAINTQVDTTFQGGDIDIGAPADGDILPLVRVPPQYPRVAASRGIEGWVILEFDITKEGTTTNVRVVDAEPSGIFNRSAIRAIEKFKYKPKIVDGKPTMRYGVQFKLTFELTK